MSETRPNKRARKEENGVLPSGFMGDIAMLETEERAVEGAEDDEDAGWGNKDGLSLEKSEVVWLPDGNIVLQTEDKRFRVHKSMLAKHSTVFDDMFKVPQPAESRTRGKTLEGCSLVRLQGDASHHWEWLLQLLYDGRRSYATSPRFEYTLVESLITLGDKYNFEHLLKEALGQFDASFPRQFTIFASNEFPKTGFQLDSDASLCGIVQLAHRFKIETSLPALYYFILIQDGYPAILHTGSTSVSGRQTELNPDTKALLIAGRDRIFEGMAKHQFRWLWHDSRLIPSLECPRPGNCRNALEALMLYLWRPLPKLKRALQSHDSLKAHIAAVLCPTCTAVSRTEFKKGQKVFWTELPTYFNLPPWEQLSQGPLLVETTDET
ncbi:hypothetical protein BKA70DRAFT_1563108 [Coprinopsis sp. MPI-PUGE-AT-0042]|nr:hypothetical protein BKA70DRAFT_1563108 [Coprinopsis sp. MPI-PUGE-AT-0042]